MSCTTLTLYSYSLSKFEKIDSGKCVKNTSSVFLIFKLWTAFYLKFPMNMYFRFNHEFDRNRFKISFLYLQHRYQGFKLNDATKTNIYGLFPPTYIAPNIGKCFENKKKRHRSLQQGECKVKYYTGNS